MRSTLLASCLMFLSFGVLGCEDATKKTDTAPAAPTVTSGAAEPGKGAMGGAMSGPASAPATSAPTAEPAPATTTPAPEPKKEEMPK